MFLICHNPLDKTNNDKDSKNEDNNNEDNNNEDNKNSGADLIPFLKKMITLAGDICIKDQNSLNPEDLEFKSSKDLVTITDKKVEAFLIQKIRQRYPEHDILGEETGRSGESSRFLWIIDPIDGTTSFVHGQPFYAVSIALEREGELILGAVYAPILGQLFHAQKGKGAFLNDIPIQVSNTQRLVDAVMATGFACLRAGLKDNNLAYFTKIVPQLRDIRRYGSAAIDLCYVACGKLDGFWEMNLNIYDIAAGVLILEEAGGNISDFSNGAHYPEQGIVAANSYLHPLLIKMLRKDNA